MHGAAPGMAGGRDVFEGASVFRRGGFATGNLLAAELRTEVRNVHSMRVRHYPRKERLIFRLPELPGLPPANQGVKNLFDVRVPYAMFHDEYQFQKDVKDFVLM